MSKSSSPGLTGFTADGTETAERLAHLERDRWPEFERELLARRPRKFRFGIHHYGLAPQRWEPKPAGQAETDCAKRSPQGKPPGPAAYQWLLHRCRSWGEVERVLNRHRVEWRRARGELLLDGATIYRCG